MLAGIMIFALPGRVPQRSWNYFGQGTLLFLATGINVFAVVIVLVVLRPASHKPVNVAA
jgi:hypothetical protein